MHDANALRTCGVDADLREMTLEEIKKLDPCFESNSAPQLQHLYPLWRQQVKADLTEWLSSYPI